MTYEPSSDEWDDAPVRGAGGLADPVQRLVAKIIDGLLLALIFGALWIIRVFGSAINPFDNDAGWGFFGPRFFFFGALALIYEVLFIGSRGQTPGKMAMSIKVIDSRTGMIPDWGSAFLRGAAPLVMNIVPFLGFVDNLWLLWDSQRQCLHDKVASTLVVRVH